MPNHRFTTIKPPSSVKRRQPRSPDPWQLSQSPKPHEQGPWLLSYLDVMTLLFSFFVMLFAYEKAQNADLIQLARTNSPSVSGRLAISLSSKGTPTPAYALTNSAIAMMKTQANVNQFSKEVSREPDTNESARERTQLQPAFDVLAHVGRSMVPDVLASEQVTSQLSSVLKDEEKRKQIEISQSANQLRMEIIDSILFAPGSASLRGEGVEILTRLAPTLIKQSGLICVEGHTDNIAINTQQFPSNWELSAARASAVTRYLIQLGLNASHLRAIGMADTHPRNSDDTIEGRARNRRVSIILKLGTEQG